MPVRGVVHSRNHWCNALWRSIVKKFDNEKHGKTPSTAGLEPGCPRFMGADSTTEASSNDASELQYIIRPNSELGHGLFASFQRSTPPCAYCSFIASFLAQWRLGHVSLMWALNDSP